MTPFKALYERGCRSPIGWFKADDVKFLGVDSVKDVQDKVSLMKGVMRFGKKDKDLQYEEESIAILDRDVRKLRTKEIKFVKVQWKHRPVEDATWEIERDMRDKGYHTGRLASYPQSCHYIFPGLYELLGSSGRIHVGKHDQDDIQGNNILICDAPI
ncbi:hypothetical protein MTR67_002386 [Solanum verrucosum]|uniref:Uncharacterized protein n=1 Tax=Solanum verrucosum TaxID=315347 RepID=A0AAF0PQS3_SOLVR|nr:hypothetical protein MTR67_002386 [Solanum verrucosum]